jgi:hypothetical protein
MILDFLTCNRSVQGGSDRFNRNRQLDYKAAADGLILVYANRSSMIFHDPADNGQT